MADTTPNTLIERVRHVSGRLAAVDGSMPLPAIVALAAASVLLLSTGVVAAATGQGERTAAAIDLPPPPPVEGPLVWDEARVTVADVEVVGMAQPPDLDPVVADIAETVERYVEAATESPLLLGEPSPLLESLFTDAAKARLGTDDRLALTDEDVPAVLALSVGEVRAGITLLAGGGGRPEVAVVAVRVEVDGFGGSGGGVTLDRSGELVLLSTPDGWRIDGYRLDASADTTGIPPFGQVLWPFRTVAA